MGGNSMWGILRRNGHSQVSLGQPQDGKLPCAREIHAQDSFREILRLERKRAERSQRRSILMLLRCCDADGHACKAPNAVSKALGPLSDAMRDTDIIGWYWTGHMMGVIFTEIGKSHEKSAEKTLLNKVAAILNRTLNPEEMCTVHLAFQAFPDAGDHRIAEGTIEFVLYRDLVGSDGAETLASGAGRALGLDPVIG